MTHAIEITSGDDVVTFLKTQHEQIKTLLGQVNSTRGQAREEAFYELRRLLAVHETAEEEIVHPKASKAIPHGDQIVDARLEEEHKGKKELAELEKLDVNSAEFEVAFGKLQSAILAHAQAEEDQEFSQLAAQLDDDQLNKMRRAAELAEKTAPTRPHAGVESAAANLIVGPFAAMMDRARDALSAPGR